MSTVTTENVDLAFGAMQAEAARGGNLRTILGGAVKTLVNKVSEIGVDGIATTIQVAYDRFTAGDNPWLPGDNTDPTSVESMVEKTGRDAIPVIVKAMLAVLL